MGEVDLQLASHRYAAFGCLASAAAVAVLYSLSTQQRMLRPQDRHTEQHQTFMKHCREARIAARRKRIQEKLAAIRQGDTTGESNDSAAAACCKQRDKAAYGFQWSDISNLCPGQ